MSNLDLYDKLTHIEKLLSEYKLETENEKRVRRFLNHPYFQLALVIVVLMMLTFLVFKAGFSIWLLSKMKFMERFGTGKGEPDFWQIGSELASYKRRQAPGYTPESKGKAGVAYGPAERFQAGNPLSQTEDSRLTSLAWRSAGAARRETMKSDNVKAKEDSLLAGKMWANTEYLTDNTVAHIMEDSGLSGIAWGLGSDQI